MYLNFWSIKKTMAHIKKFYCISDNSRSVFPFHPEYGHTIFFFNTTFKTHFFIRNSIVFIFPAEWRKMLVDFYHIWPLTQWITSLITLVLLYWVTGYFYNKWLSERGGWLDFKMRIWLIISDLLINLSLGLYYMQYRDTLMGGIMLKCPIAISPIIFMLELICVYMYYRFWKTKEKKTKD